MDTRKTTRNHCSLQLAHLIHWSNLQAHNASQGLHTYSNAGACPSLLSIVLLILAELSKVELMSTETLFEPNFLFAQHCSSFSPTDSTAFSCYLPIRTAEFFLRFTPDFLASLSALASLCSDKNEAVRLHIRYEWTNLSWHLLPLLTFCCWLSTWTYR